ncbi:MAG TPA: hypothetical protein VKX17_14750 [Planctomycetota bacterium]|nr:hypothetical protein [Planctomycetota bacterium]
MRARVVAGVGVVSAILVGTVVYLEIPKRQHARVTPAPPLFTLSPDPFVNAAALRSLANQVKSGAANKSECYRELIPLFSDVKVTPRTRADIADFFLNTLDDDPDNIDSPAIRVLQIIALNNSEASTTLRVKCIDALGRRMKSIAILNRLLSDPNNEVRKAAVLAATALLEREHFADKLELSAMRVKMCKIVADENAWLELREAAIRAMGPLIAQTMPGATNELDTVIKLVKTSTDDSLVAAGIEALGTSGAPEAVDALIATYNDYFDAKKPARERDVPIRLAVIKAVRAILIAQASTPHLDEACVHKCSTFLSATLHSDPVASVKQAAVYALAYLYPKKFESEWSAAVDALIESLEKPDTDSELKKRIVDALEALTTKNFGENAARWREWQKSRK